MILQSRRSRPTTAAMGNREGDRERRLTLAMGAILAGLSFMACKLGERAAAHGQCPPGETCSSRTPSGLIFVGAHTFNGAKTEAGEDLLPTAVGGKQTVSARYADPPFAPYVAGFEAKLFDSSVATIESATPTSIVLRGESEGAVVLRLLEPGTNQLLDRTAIVSAPIARVSLLPQEFREKSADDTSWGVLAGSRAVLGVLLFDQSNHQIVDEALNVSASAAEVARQTWDLYEIMPQNSFSVSFAVRAGGRAFVVDARVVSSIGNIVQKSPAGPEGTPISVKVGQDPAELCFLAMDHFLVVAGATWRFEPSEAIVIAPRESAAPGGSRWEPPNCVKISGKKPGPATLHVTASGYRKTFNIVVNE